MCLQKKSEPANFGIFCIIFSTSMTCEFVLFFQVTNAVYLALSKITTGDLLMNEFVIFYSLLPCYLGCLWILLTVPKRLLQVLKPNNFVFNRKIHIAIKQPLHTNRQNFRSFDYACTSRHFVFVLWCNLKKGGFVVLKGKIRKYSL
eukprot:m.313655 g.313655  ORF g.313655 m.313655 type:complete len:146 (+) comp16491_c9_seq3:192-629(+)